MGTGSPVARIDLATGRRYPPLGNGELSSGDAWRGLRLEGLDIPAGEFHDSYYTQHLVFVAATDASVENWSPPANRSRVVRLRPRSILLLPALIPISVRWEALAATEVFVDPGLLPGLRGEPSGSQIALQPLLEPEEDSLLAEMVLALRADVEARLPAGPGYGEALGSAIAAHLVRRYATAERRTPDRGGLRFGQLRRLEELIDQNLDRTLRLQELADAVQLSLFHFVRAFKQSTGVPPHRYILRKRVDRAKCLLRDTSLSLVEVGHRCGFVDQSRFTAVFHRFTNATPGAYRRSRLLNVS